MLTGSGAASDSARAPTEALSAISSQALAAAGPLRGRRFFFGGLVAGILVMSAVGVAVAALADSPRDVAARFVAPAPPVLTATARWHVLTDPITVAGVVTAARTISVTARAPFGVVTVTKLPVRPGDRVRPGHVIAEVDGRPILLLAGKFPAYRDLHEGDSGPDVTQLQEALEDVGYANFDPDGVFGPSTALALTLLYRHLGYAAPLHHPHRRRGQVSGQAPGQESSAYLPMSEVTFIPGKSAFVLSVNAQVGTIVRGEPIMRLATGRAFVASELSGYQAAHARRGMAVSITSASPALKAKGRLARIGKLESPSGGAGPGTGTGSTGTGGSATTQYPIDVRCRRPLPLRLIGTRVRLTIAPPLTTRPVLLVPVTAIFGPSRQQGTHVIEIAADGRRSTVAVFTGPTAGGLVAVQPVRAGALRSGNRVVIGIGGRS